MVRASVQVAPTAHWPAFRPKSHSHHALPDALKPGKQVHARLQRGEKHGGERPLAVDPSNP